MRHVVVQYNIVLAFTSMVLSLGKLRNSHGNVEPGACH
jgi:hypothetical protein